MISNGIGSHDLLDGVWGGEGSAIISPPLILVRKILSFCPFDRQIRCATSSKAISKQRTAPPKALSVANFFPREIPERIYKSAVEKFEVCIPPLTQK